MDSKVAKFKELIDASSKILITSHISPDPDAISSVLALGRTLELNYPDKSVRMALEERPAKDISFLEGYNSIHFGPLMGEFEAFKPDLVVIVDAMSYRRVSRQGFEKLTELAKSNESKLAIIDHHTKEGLESNDLYINDRLAATALQLYLLLFKEMNLKKPANIADTLLLGIVTDTGRHRYDDPHHRVTFGVVSDLIDAGASIEQLENRLDRYTSDEMRALSDLAGHMTDSGKGYSYTFIGDDLADKQYNAPSFKMACEVFTSQFMRNFEQNKWGFIVYPEIIDGQKTYSVSFRAVSGEKDVSKIAGQLGGGGHVQAAGAKNIKASTVDEAVRTVEAAIEATA